VHDPSASANVSTQPPPIPALPAPSTDWSRAKTQAGGYSILQAESMDALAVVLEGHPHFMAPGASIEAHEVMPIPRHVTRSQSLHNSVTATEHRLHVG
jgi:hypothetical protein